MVSLRSDTCWERRAARSAICLHTRWSDHTICGRRKLLRTPRLHAVLAPRAFCAGQGQGSQFPNRGSPHAKVARVRPLCRSPRPRPWPRPRPEFRSPSASTLAPCRFHCGSLRVRARVSPASAANEEDLPCGIKPAFSVTLTFRPTRPRQGAHPSVGRHIARKSPHQDWCLEAITLERTPKQRLQQT